MPQEPKPLPLTNAEAGIIGTPKPVLRSELPLNDLNHFSIRKQLSDFDPNVPVLAVLKNVDPKKVVSVDIALQAKRPGSQTSEAKILNLDKTGKIFIANDEVPPHIRMNDQMLLKMLDLAKIPGQTEGVQVDQEAQDVIVEAIAVEAYLSIGKDSVNENSLEKRVNSKLELLAQNRQKKMEEEAFYRKLSDPKRTGPIE